MVGRVDGTGAVLKVVIVLIKMALVCIMRVHRASMLMPLVRKFILAVSYRLGPGVVVATSNLRVNVPAVTVGLLCVLCTLMVSHGEFLGLLNNIMVVMLQVGLRAIEELGNRDVVSLLVHEFGD